MINRNPWPSGYVLAILFIFALGLSHELLAQQAGQAPPSAPSQTQTKSGNDPGATQSQPAPAYPPATSQTQPATPQTQTKPANNPGSVQSGPAPDSKHPQNDRIFFALPNYLTVEKSASLPPLTTREKFKTVAEGCFDPVEVVFIGIEAGIGQADNTNPTYGQGFMVIPNASGQRMPTPSSETSGRAPYSPLCYGKTRATTRGEKGISSTVPGTPPCGLSSRARTRREKLSSTSPNFSVMAWPQASPMRTIRAPIRSQAAPTFWLHKLCWMPPVTS